ncbi:hypothetical protein HK103_004358 [Boothiomyces macroporosus]|uniref:Uncharacterized protein n=1 Tax=Boothiomyces macroporosus TaxID=261099 RepID=A0AAD5UJD7_9FUNG|nr:hypothetical protein HK103_004358 [Boothiomyces macroporosus]
MSLTPQSKKLIFDIALLACTQVCLYYGIKYILNTMDPQRKKKDLAKIKSSKIMSKMGKSDLELTEHEEMIASEIIWPEDLTVTFGDIGGLEPIIDSLRETVIYPLVYPELFQQVSGLLGAPRGVLLYGPPVIITNNRDDEIDCFLRERKSNDHEATSMMKAEFMTLWDGLNTGEATQIMILGATNRPNDLDKAILRRMPKRFSVQLPDKAQRRKVLELILKKVGLEDGFDFDYLASITDGYSNADLKELCRNAVMVPVRESIKRLNHKEMGKVDVKVRLANFQSLTIRMVQMSDFVGFVDHLYNTAETLLPIPAELD